MNNNILSLTRQVYFNRSGILLLIVIIIASIFAVLAYRSVGIEKDIYVAIATGLYSTAAFSFLQSMITGLRYEEVVSQSIEDSVKKAMNKALNDLDLIHKEFLPEEIFPASDIEDNRFNSKIRSDITLTRRYTFLGVTGRYAIARLVESQNILDEAHIVIADPFSDGCIEHRVRHLAKYSRTQDAFLIHKQKIISEILEAVSGAPLAAIKCKKLILYFMSKPIVDRFEMFDRCVYLTLFSDERRTAAKFPRTLQFNSDTSSYKIISTFFSPASLDASRAIVVTPESSLEYIKGKLVEMGGSDEKIDIGLCRSNFERFIETVGGRLAPN